MISKYLIPSDLRNNISPIQPIEKIRINQYGTEWKLQKDYSTNTFYEIDNYFSEIELQNIINLGKKIVSSEAKVGNENKNAGKVNEEIRVSNVSWIPINDFTKWLYESITRLVIDVNESIYNFDLTYFESIQFSRYDSSSQGNYKSHVDGGMINSFGTDRKLSMVLQLSDPEDYTGGDLILNNGNSPTTIKKSKGKIVFFQSNMLHEVTKVTSGTRFSLVCWFTGPRFK